MGLAGVLGMILSLESIKMMCQFLSLIQIDTFTFWRRISLVKVGQ